MMNNMNKVLMYPFKLVFAFLIFSELLFFFGPVKFECNAPVLLMVYLLIVNFSFWLGYKTGLRNFTPSYFKFKTSTIQIFLILGLILSVFRLRTMWSSHGLAISINTLISGIINPADTYFSDAVNGPENSGTLSLLLSPIMWMALPLGVYKWKALSPLYKAITILTILVQVISWLGIGTRKGLFDIIVIILFISIAANTSILTDPKKRKRFVRFVVAGAILFVFYFVFSNLSRYGLGLGEINDFNMRAEIRPFYSEKLPTWLLVTLVSITGYLCQGYHALSMALSLGFLPPAFMGSSWFTMVIAQKFGYNPMPDTYMAALEPMGIDPSINWHTIYVWLANDVTFIGVPLIIFLIGYFFSKTWADCVYGNNDAAVSLFALFLIMTFYFYANNQVISFSFMPFVVCFAIYVFSRIKKV